MIHITELKDVGQASGWQLLASGGVLSLSISAKALLVIVHSMQERERIEEQAMDERIARGSAMRPEATVTYRGMDRDPCAQLQNANTNAPKHMCMRLRYGTRTQTITVATLGLKARFCSVSILRLSAYHHNVHYVTLLCGFETSEGLHLLGEL